MIADVHRQIIEAVPSIIRCSPPHEFADGEIPASLRLRWRSPAADASATKPNNLIQAARDNDRRNLDKS